VIYDLVCIKVWSDLFIERIDELGPNQGCTSLLFFFFFFFFLCLVLWLAQLHHIDEDLVVCDGYVPHLKCFGNTKHSKLKYSLFLQALLFSKKVD
jgi:hypothetical protein